MTKAELLNWLEGEYKQWLALLDKIGPERMEQPGFTEQWSFKDMVAHLTVWNRHMVARMEAAESGETEPPAPWSENLNTDDEINAWIYDSTHGLTAEQVLNDSRQDFDQLFAVMERLSADVQIETAHGRPGREYYLLWLNGTRYQPGEFFDHYKDDHEEDARAWLARQWIVE